MKSGVSPSNSPLGWQYQEALPCEFGEQFPVTRVPAQPVQLPPKESTALQVLHTLDVVRDSVLVLVVEDVSVLIIVVEVSGCVSTFKFSIITQNSYNFSSSKPIRKGASFENASQ